MDASAEEMLMTRGRGLALSSGRNTWVVRTRPDTLVEKRRSISDSSAVSHGSTGWPLVATPARSEVRSKVRSETRSGEGSGQVRSGERSDQVRGQIR